MINTIKTLYDIEYKKKLLKSLNDKSITIENLSSIVGEEELIEILKSYQNKPQNFSVSPENVEKKLCRANLHMHSKNSDGQLSIEEILNKCSNYANEVKVKFPDEQYPFLIAITDHNNVNGDIEAVKLISKNPEKYKNLKVVLGVEIFATFFKEGLTDFPIETHMLTLAVNPFEHSMKNTFFKKDSNEKLNYRFRTVEEAVNIIQAQKYGLIGIAHPSLFVCKNKLTSSSDEYLDALFEHYYSLKKSKPLFTEAFYQAYAMYNINQHSIDYVHKICEEKNILKSGSTDTHSKNIFTKK